MQHVACSSVTSLDQTYRWHALLTFRTHFTNNTILLQKKFNTFLNPLSQHSQQHIFRIPSRAILLPQALKRSGSFDKQYKRAPFSWLTISCALLNGTWIIFFFFRYLQTFKYHLAAYFNRLDTFKIIELERKWTYVFNSLTLDKSNYRIVFLLTRN